MHRVHPAAEQPCCACLRTVFRLLCLLPCCQGAGTVASQLSQLCTRSIIVIIQDLHRTAQAPVPDLGAQRAGNTPPACLHAYKFDCAGPSIP